MFDLSGEPKPRIDKKATCYQVIIEDTAVSLRRQFTVVLSRRRRILRRRRQALLRLSRLLHCLLAPAATPKDPNLVSPMHALLGR